MDNYGLQRKIERNWNAWECQNWLTFLSYSYSFGSGIILLFLRTLGHGRLMRSLGKVTLIANRLLKTVIENTCAYTLVSTLFCSGRYLVCSESTALCFRIIRWDASGILSNPTAPSEQINVFFISMERPQILYNHIERSNGKSESLKWKCHVHFHSFGTD